MNQPGTVVKLPPQGVVKGPDPGVYLCPEHKSRKASAVLFSAPQSRLATAMGVQTYQCIECRSRFAVAR